MRIAMVGHKRVPSREGGIEVVVEELAARMVIHGHTVTCYNRSGHHVSGREYDAEHLDEYRGIRLKHLPTIDRKGLAAVTSSFFGCLAAAFGPYNVVHVHAEGPAMFSWIPRLTGKRVILTIHGLDWARDKWKGSFGSWYIRMGEKTGARCVHEIIVLNHSTQKYFLDTYGRTTHYIPNGVNPAAPVPADIIREKYGLEKDSYILYLGRMVPEKGCHYLVDAFKKLDTDKKLAEFLPFGNQHQRIRIKHRIIHIASIIDCISDPTLALLHGSRIVRTYLTASLQQLINQDQSRSFTHIISLRFESKSPQSNRFSFQVTIKMLHQLFKQNTFLLLVYLFHSTEHPHFISILFCRFDKGFHIFRETRTAIADSRIQEFTSDARIRTDSATYHIHIGTHNLAQVCYVIHKTDAGCQH